MNKPLECAARVQWMHVKHVFSRADGTFGIERVLRACLVLAPFLYPTLYIKSSLGKWGAKCRIIAVEALVILKVLIAGCLLAFSGHGIWVGVVTVYMMTETVSYLLAIIMLSDIYAPPISKGRSFLLLCLNYIEMTMGFANLYLCLGGVKGVSGRLDALYFSFVSFTTLGYGDKCPDACGTKLLVIVQLMVMLLFVFLFFIKLTPEMKNAGTAGSAKAKDRTAD